MCFVKSPGKATQFFLQVFYCYWVSFVIWMVLVLLLDLLFLGFLYFLAVGHTEKLILF